MRRASDRGQSLNDFVIGVGLFLLVLGYTFAFLPTVFEPFLDGGAGSTQPADRTADHLTEDALARNASEEAPSAAIPGLLNGTCTEAFFDDSVSNPPDGCRYETKDLTELAAVPDRLRLNVTVVRNGTVVDRNGVTLARGPTPEGANDVAEAVRIVTLDRRDARLVVRVW